MGVKSAKDLIVYKKAYDLAMEVFGVSKCWPVEERYSLTDQIRRSSRSVCVNLCEAWARRKYPAHFVSKLAYSDAENGETQTWLDFARDCHYLQQDDFERLVAECKEVGAMLGNMLKDASPWLLTSDS